MTSIGATLLWCVLQVTAVATAAVATYLLSSRGGATARGGVALAGLVVAALLAPLAFSPWPKWEPLRETRSIAVVAGGATSQTVAEARPAEGSNVAPRSTDGETASVWTAAWNGFVSGLNDPQPSARTAAAAPSPEPLRWRVVVAWLFVAAAVAGAVRLALGAWSVRRTIQRAKPVYDPTLFGLVDVLHAELSCTTPVELRESHEVATAATAGWRKPVLLLPSDWHGWTETERRAVIAHELAHVKRRDYLAAVAAQTALAVHFYHPLLHWLAGRLRLEQELAADALAASVSGGRTVYLRTLAELALRRSDGRVAWPARAFLPSRRTFLRRIEMLRDPRRAADHPAPLLRTLSVAGLLLFGITVAGFRPVTAQNPEEQPAADVAADDGDALKKSAEPGDLAAEKDTQPSVSPVVYIPATATFVMVNRPAELLEDEAIKPFAAQVEELVSVSKDPMWKTLREAGVTPRAVETVAMGILPTHKSSHEPAAFAVRLNKPIDRSVIEKAATSKTTTFGGILYQIGKDTIVTMPDDRTLLAGQDEATLTAMLVGGQLNRAASPWLKIDDKLGKPALGVLIDAETLSSLLRKELFEKGRGQEAQVGMMLAPIMPALNDMKIAGVGLVLGGEPGLRGYAEADDESSAGRVAETLRALVTLGKNTLRQVKGQAGGQNLQQQQLAKMFIPIAEKLLNTAKVESAGVDVTLTAEAGGSSAIALGLLLPAIQQAREAARRTQSMGHLKKIGLAFHNYHDVYGFLPPAVIVENGVERSWRVEILPFVEAGNLYEYYRKNEPWDSEHNKTILEQMPEVYRDPSHGESAPTSTSYYLLTSANAVTDPPADGAEAPDGTGGFAAPPAAGSTLFTDKPIDPRKGGKGPGFPQITDGTSNTLMVVEAKRDVPWTKPEDIPFDPAKVDELIKNDLGGNHTGGFLALFCDGAVRFIATSVDRDVFKGLVTPAGGEAIGVPPATPQP
ncbi:MAG: DUF1559 domain-containing protein [Planctomycetaceae bacterium]